MFLLDSPKLTLKTFFQITQICVQSFKLKKIYINIFLEYFTKDASCMSKTSPTSRDTKIMKREKNLN